MATGERERHQLHRRLDEVLGAEVAGILMSYLPPVGWAEVATKHDLAELEGRLANRFEATLHRELGGQSTALRTEFHEELGKVRTEFRGELGKLRTESREDLRELREALRKTTRVYILGNIGLVFAVVAAVAGLGRLF